MADENGNVLKTGTIAPDIFKILTTYFALSAIPEEDRGDAVYRVPVFAADAARLTPERILDIVCMCAAADQYVWQAAEKYRKRDSDERYSSIEHGARTRLTTWESLAVTARAAQVFDFGAVSHATLINEAKRAGPLWRKGFLSLPYPACLYSLTTVPTDPAGAQYERERKLHTPRTMLLIQRYQHDADVGQSCLVATFMETEPRGYVLISVAALAWNDGDTSFRVTNAFRISDADAKSLYLGAIDEHGNFVPFASHDVMNQAVDIMLALSLILTARGVPLRHEPAPQKLNKKRERSGKSQLSKVTHVDTRYYYEAAANTAGGRHHKSPVPHLRRGHIRRLHGGERTTWVRDAIISLRSVEELSERDHYEVKAQP